MIRDLATALHYGSNNVSRTIAAGVVHGAGQLLPSIFGRATDEAAVWLSTHRIERVTFVATKADHVPALRRDNLLLLLRVLADAGRLDRASTGVSHHVAASILSTMDGVSQMQGRPVEVVQGTVLGEERVRPFFVGDVPASMPPDGFWSDRFFELPVFKPPLIDPVGMTGIPHLNLDQVVDDVIGDLL